jgi:hydroxymethylpyrimidine/phosphomethylpyrimidine kinase
MVAWVNLSMNDPTTAPDATTPPVALTIAGSDSGGGAGIQADLLTFSAHGVFGTTAITAVTAQNTVGVQEVTVLSRDKVETQIASVTQDFVVAAAKTGMLATAEIIDLVREIAEQGTFPYLVVDPVMIATTGARLLDENARDSYLRLLPFVDIVTPNLPETEYLVGHKVSDVAGMELAARSLYELGAKAVVVKGGHLMGERSIDVFFDGTQVALLDDEMVATQNVHGTGCTLSAAITANLAHGLSILESVARAKSYVTTCLRSAASWKLGGGAGPVNHCARRD